MVSSSLCVSIAPLRLLPPSHSVSLPLIVSPFVSTAVTLLVLSIACFSSQTTFLPFSSGSARRNLAASSPEESDRVALAPALQGAPSVRLLPPLAVLNSLLVFPLAMVIGALSGDAAYGDDLFRTAAYTLRYTPPSTRLVAIDREQLVTLARWRVKWRDIFPTWDVLGVLAGLLFHRRDWIVSALQRWSDSEMLRLRDYVPPPIYRRARAFDATLLRVYAQQSGQATSKQGGETDGNSASTAASAEQLATLKRCLPAATMIPMVAARNGCPPSVTGLHPALVDERDRILSHNLYHLSGGQSVVAVVGLGHLDGIERYWGASAVDAEEDIRELCKPPRFHALRAALPGAAILGAGIGLWTVRKSHPRLVRGAVGAAVGLTLTTAYAAKRLVTEVQTVVSALNAARTAPSPSQGKQKNSLSARERARHPL